MVARPRPRPQPQQRAPAVRPQARPHKYGRIHGGARPDIPYKVRSAWEANFVRLLLQHWLHRPFTIRRFDYEEDVFYFPGERRGNFRIFPDFHLWSATYRQERHKDHIGDWYVEVKGLLRRGGRLTRVDLNQLRGRDEDSRVKLDRFRRHYPQLAARTWLVGEREYLWLQRRYGHRTPGWEWAKSRPPTTAALPAPSREDAS